MIPYSKHFIDKDDIDAVVDVLRNKSIKHQLKIMKNDLRL